MNARNKQDYKYAAFKTLKASEPLFVDMTNESNVEKFLDQYGNQNPQISTWYSAVPDISVPRNYSLYFRIVSNNPETARISALELINYIEETYGIPDENIVIVFNGSGSSSEDFKDGSPVAEIVLLIHPIVFGGLPTPLMPAINYYYLARQMVDGGLSNIDIDVYQQDSFIPLPNSISNSTSRSVYLTPKELLYMDGLCIVDLSKQPMPDDLMVTQQEVPEAVEWFFEVHTDFEKKLLRQDELQKLILKKGWQVPACIRRLMWSDFDDSTVFEACRLISGAYSFLGSHEEEIRYHVMRLARRNSITGFTEYQKLNNIVTYGVENPMLVECQHPLMSRFCPTGGCYIAELIEEYEKPLLFE